MKDILCTEGLIESGTIDFIFNYGWRPATLESLRAAQHGVTEGQPPSATLPNAAVISCFLVHFPDLIARIAQDNPNGKYVLVVRDGDPSMREGGGPNCNVNVWPSFIHHIFGISVIEKTQRITPIPGGVWAFRSPCDDDIAATNEIPRVIKNRVLVCHRYDGGGMFRPGHERHTSVEYFRMKPWATIHPANLDMQPGKSLEAGVQLWSHRDYLAQVRTHDYLACPVGYGVERISPWEAMSVGTIPIYLKHPEMMQFADMPLAFVDNWSDVTPEWCDANLHLRTRSIEKVRVPYWVDRIREKRTEIGL